MWWVYLIKTRLDTLYCGISTDVERRFQEHLQGAPKGAKALRGKAPLKLMFAEEIGDRAQASQIEYAIKKRLNRAQKDQLIQGALKLSEYFPEIFLESKD